MTTPTFTGFQRQRTSSRRVRMGDAIARLAITMGGFATIGAVALVSGFLLWTVLPLFAGSEIGPAQVTATAAAPPSPVLAVQMDPDRQTALVLRRDGVVRLHPVGVDQRVDEVTIAALPSASASAVRGGYLSIGDAAGTVTVVRLGIEVDAPQRPGGGPDRRWISGAGALAHTYGLAYRPEEPLRLGAAVLGIDMVAQDDAFTLAAITADARLVLRRVEHRVNPFTDEIEASTAGSELPLPQFDGIAPPPTRVLVAGSGETVLLLWEDGHAVRIDCRDIESPRVVEHSAVLVDGARLTASGFLIGGNTLLVGDDRGRVRALFKANVAGAGSADGAELVVAHSFAGTAPVVAIATSQRNRVFAVARRDGRVDFCSATTNSVLASVAAPPDEPLQAIALAPKDDGLLVATASQLRLHALRPGHPEFSTAAVALPTWYEGYPGPEHVWQSTGGTDDFEPKLGLWPLVFGTLKATLYSLLFGVPLALLAAVYTSQFLHARSRARIKPIVESMASLPSVVLGFLAALVFAPLVESSLATILIAFATVPFAWLLGAELIEALPGDQRVAAERHRLAAAAAAVVLGIALACILGPFAEQLLFGGDLQQWLALPGQGLPAVGSPFGGWLALFLPIALALVALSVARQQRISAWCQGPLRPLRLAAVSIALAAGVAALPTLAGLDLRGDLLGTYVQRNALIVGIVMGFAVIPIVYTIAEDALAAVPEHLRAASLGAGATPWQTAARVILPTASSGIFSAIMVGLGRAVGETMIVLMAAGNTPVLELNPFNGFRTLSANIAVELPEAVRGSTHYRVLYLAALVLFAITFLLNTAAEVVRQRFRRRAFQL